MKKSETKFIIVNYRRDQAVQNWSFADKKHIIYCNSAEWAMKFADKAGAKRTLDYLRKNFPGQDLSIVEATFYSDVTFKEIKG